MYNIGISGFSGFAIIVLVLAVIIVIKAVQTVSQGYEYTVERFGRYTKTLSPGFHLIIPIIDRRSRWWMCRRRRSSPRTTP